MTTIIMDYKRKSKELGFFDQSKPREILKIGKEINRYKQMDGRNTAEVERRFGKDANALFAKKIDPNLTKKITQDIVKGLKQARERR